MKEKEIRERVRQRYAGIARKGSSCCENHASCCGDAIDSRYVAEKIGYAPEDLNAVPEGANLGLGCGNPIAMASLKEGETVLDLGSGAGLDCFLAARRVGPRGHVIGVDMTPEMISQARKNAEMGGYNNVEFRLGEIEHLPVADNAVDVIISNCVINLSPDKPQVFREAYRVLKPGGRLIVSDIVLLRPLPAKVQKSVEAYTGCIAGAMLEDDYLRIVAAAGFRDVQILRATPFPLDCIVSDPSASSLVNELGLSGQELGDIVASIVSIQLSGRK